MNQVTTHSPGAVAAGVALHPSPHWRLATRIAFRFAVVYVGLYVALTQMLGALIILPVGDLPDLGVRPPMRTLVTWVATHVFHVTRALVITGSGSGDKTYDWVHAFTLLVIAGAGTAVWSILDRRRRHYTGLYKWFRVFARFALGSTMIQYGMFKAIPLQMPAPPLTRLLEPYGNFSPMGVLWYSIGASHSYETVVGCAELIGGALLFLPRTAILGALICLFDAIQIFTLNMTYDVPVKLFAFHLILLSLLLLAPEASRLLNVLLLNRTAGPSTQPPLLRSRRGQWIAFGVQGLLGAYLLAMNVYGDVQSWRQFGGGAPKSALYGIWNVDEMTIDGQTRAPLLTDRDRWRRVIFQSPAFASFWRMDDTYVSYPAVLDMSAHTLTLTRGSDKTWKSAWSFEQPAAEQLVLDGDMDNHHIHMRLQLFDQNKFFLVSRGFNWIQEYPVNR